MPVINKIFITLRKPDFKGGGGLVMTRYSSGNWLSEDLLY